MRCIKHCYEKETEMHHWSNVSIAPILRSIKSCFSLILIQSRLMFFSTIPRKKTKSSLPMSILVVLISPWTSKFERSECEHPTIETLQAVRKFSAVVLESLYTRFLSGSPDDIMSPTTNLDRDLDGSKNHPRISSSTVVICIMEKKSKFIKFKEIIT
jgi:hypothetical protein